MRKDEINLEVHLGRLILKNPVLVASGTFSYEYTELIDISKLGAVVTKAVTLRKRRGNRPPRTWETSCGLLNSIGLENPGVEHFLEKDLPRWRRWPVKLIVNVAGETVEEYAELARILDGAEGVDALEANISCPNIREGGIFFGVNPEMSYRVISAMRSRTSKPLIAKLTPNVTDIVSIAGACVEAGAEILSLINTLRGLAIDPDTFRPRLGKGFGGLSGPAIKPLAVGMIHQVYRALDVPLIGIGGILDYRDAVEFFLAGARAVAVGTGNFVNPRIPLEIIEGLTKFLEEKGMRGVEDLVGKVRFEVGATWPRFPRTEGELTI
ncbi:dihydroorotate dehydrogenase (NAD+) catalytic subunit [Candidatus Hakubella thermalkaliphila]|uniref:Dihydroorotate dehydrogenase n=1 Tax=Candidatus Hakubella thermalkaliphila TaxID=2754717 RepID=A0A6V8NZD3_9ACTN|nr:dihydroorotate dehydrogenase (NAD+) catalytic subunit [Candidatus Hakubella thermalkaliphila]